MILKKFAGSKCVIVCPQKMISTWKKEINFWCGKRLPIANTLEEFKSISLSVIFIVSYEGVKDFANQRFGNGIKLRIFDEGHRLNNSATDAYKNCQKIPGDYTLLLTGTVITNTLVDYRNIINFVYPATLDENDSTFKKIFKMTVDGLEKLRQQTNFLVLRRSLDVIRNTLPKRTLVNVFFNQLSSKQMTEYENVILESNTSSLIKARIITNISKDIVNKYRSKTENSTLSVQDIIQSSSKIEFLMNFIHEMFIANDDEKVIIMSHGTDTFLNIFEIVLKDSDLEYAYIGDGRNSMDHELLKFNTINSCRVILVSTKAGGCGLNLCRGKYLFLTDLDWNPAVDSQAMSRNYRIGQKVETFVFKLIATDTIDESIYMQQEMKELMSALVMNEPLPNLYRLMSSKQINDALKLIGRSIGEHLKPGICEHLRNNSSIWNEFKESICPIFYRSQRNHHIASYYCEI